VARPQHLVVAGVLYLNRRQFFEAVASRYGCGVPTVSSWFYANRLSPEQILDRARAQARGRRPIWTSAALDHLVEHYGRVTATEIAVRLGVSRSAIIGKAHRLGLCSPEPGPAPPPAMTEADFRGCRWIEGDALPLRPGMFCTGPVEQPGSAWCEWHRRRVFSGQAYQEPAAGHPALAGVARQRT
jgi:hypothetical protein